MMTFQKRLPFQRLRATLVFAIALFLLAFSTSSASAQSIGRGRNIINDRFATVSSGPQESLIVDVPTGKGTSSTPVVERRLISYWSAQQRAMIGHKQGSNKTNRVLPVSTLIRNRTAGRLVAPPGKKTTRGYGNGNLTLSFESFNGASLADSNGNPIILQDFLQNFYEVVKPKLDALYGKPSTTGTLAIKSMGFFETGTATDVERLAFGAYNVSENRIYLPLYRSIDTLANAFLLNLIHAYHGPLAFHYDAWEQGFARAAASVIARDASLGFQDPTANNLYTLLPQYDLLNHPALGNNTFFPPSQANIPIDGQFTIAKMLQPRLGMAGAAWLKVWMENPDFFRQFNESYYAAVDADPTGNLQGNVPFLSALVRNVVSDVEGLPFQQWMQRQFVLDTSITGGTKLFPYILPSENSAATGQSALIALVYYRTTPVGDETLLNGRAYAEYHDATGSRIPSLGSSSEQAQVTDGEGFLTTLSFPSQGFDDGRITMDFSIGQMTTRAYLPSGITGDLQVVWAGTAPTGDVNVTQILTPGGQQRNGQTTIARAGAGFTLGAAFGELYKTRISRAGVSVGEIITISRNLGDGINWVVIKTDNTGGGITTVSKRFPTNELRLVSFPARPLNADPSAILNLPFMDFVLTQYDPLRNIYEMAAPDKPLLGPVVPGRAFWMKLVPENKSTHEVSYAGEIPTTDIDLPVATPFGWNMIGSPFDTLIDTASLKVIFLDNDPITWAEAVTKNLVAADIFKWDPATRKYIVATQLENTEWQGYWVRVYAPSGVTILIPGPTGTTLAVTALGVSRSIPVPALQNEVRIAINDGSGASEILTAGTANGASDAFNPGLDKEGPPFGGMQLSASFVAPKASRVSGRLLNDIRSATSAQSGTWDLDVTPAASGTLTIQVMPITVAKETRLTLVDRQSGNRHLISQNGQVIVQGTAGKPMRFQLILTPKASIPLQVRNIRIQSVGRSNVSTRIVVQTTRSAETTADLETLMGRKVAGLVPSRSVTGTESTFAWDGRGSDGRETPAGTYILRIKMVDEDGNQVVTTRPLTRLR
jgi:hypothetical protein